MVVDPGNSALFDTPPFWTTGKAVADEWAPHQAVRFVPEDPMDQEAYEAAYGLVRALVLSARWPSAVVCSDEAETCLPATAKGAGPALVYSGRKWPTGHIATSTRPRGISVACRANLSHAALFPLWADDDRRTLCADLGIPRQLLDACMAELPVPSPLSAERGFLWWTSATRSLRPVFC